MGNFGSKENHDKDEDYAPVESFSAAELSARVSSTQHGGEPATLTYVLGGQDLSGNPDAYFGLAEEMAKDIIGGGSEVCGGFIGGVDDPLSAEILSNYETSLNSHVKKQLIEKIAKVVSSFQPALSQISDPQKQVKEFLKLVNSIDGSIPVEKQSRVCKAIATAINEHYHRDVINMSVGDEALCAQVRDLIVSLQHGMFVEFLAVKNELTRTMSNLKMLRDMLDNHLYEPVFDEIDESVSGKAAEKAALVKGKVKLVLKELDRQIVILENLLNTTVSDSESKLAELIKKSKLRDVLVGDIGSADDQFGKVLLGVLQGIGVTATYLDLIDRALKTVGLTMAEWSSSKGQAKLASAMSDKVLSESLSDKQREDILEAYELLKKNFPSAQYIQMEGKSMGRYGGASDVYNEKDNIHSIDNREGRTLDKRVKNDMVFKKLVFETFQRLNDQQWRSFTDAVTEIAKKLGVMVPVTEQLEDLVESFKRMQPLAMRKNSYLILVGYFNDTYSKQARSSFMDQLKHVIGCTDALLNMSEYGPIKPQLENLKASAKGLMVLADRYSDKIVERFGSGERKDPEGRVGGEEDPACGVDCSCPVCECSPCECAIMGGDDCTACGGDSTVGHSCGGRGDCGLAAPEHVLGGSPSGYFDEARVSIYGGADDEFLAQDSPGLEATFDPRALSDAFKLIDHNLKLGRVTENITHMKNEPEHYAKEYQTMCDKALAFKMDEIAGNRDALLKKLDAYGESSSALPVEDKKRIPAVRKTVEVYANARINLWKTAGAIDEYLRMFTKDLILGAPAAQDLKDDIANIDVINRWSESTRTGKIICEVFDLFPATDGHATADPARREVISAKKGTTDATDAGSILPSVDYSNANHYYDAIATMADDIKAYTLPGCPYLLRLPTTGVFEGFSKMRELTNNLALIKNILQIFIKIGKKYGNTPRSRMSSAQMYANLSTYLEVCTFGFGVQGKSDNDKDPTRINSDGASKGDIKGKSCNADVNGDYECFGPFETGNGTLDSFYQCFGVFMRSHHLGNHSPFMGGRYPDHPMRMEEDDKMFVMILKSLCSKVMAVAGMSDVFKRPNEPIILSPLRGVLGGATPSVPAIKDSVVELYLRLPLLIYLYKEIMDFDGILDRSSDYQNKRLEHNTIAFKISMLPDIGGPFSKLVKKIFRTPKDAEITHLSDMELAEIFTDVNEIWDKLSPAGGKNPVMFIIREAVREVNQYYGIVSSELKENWEKEDRLRHDLYAKLNNGEETRDALSRIPELFDGERDLMRTDSPLYQPAPSDKYRKLPDGSSLDGIAGSYKIPNQPIDVALHTKLIHEFRCKLDSYFRKEFNNSLSGDDDDGNNTTWNGSAFLGRTKIGRESGYNMGSKDVGQNRFRGALKSAKLRLKDERNKDNRFKIVVGLIRNATAVGLADHIKYVMFHETVITGLNTLNIIWNTLWNFKQIALVTSPEVYSIEYDDGSGTTKSALEYADDAKGTPADVPKAISRGIGEFIAKKVGGNPEDNATQVNTNVCNYLIDLTTPAHLTQKSLSVLLHALQNIGNDLQGLVDVRISENSVSVNFSKLKQMVVDFMQSIQYFAGHLRPHIDAAVFEKYMLMKNVGSFFWLEENLVQRLLNGRKGYDSTKKGTSGLNQGWLSMDQLNPIINDSLKSLGGKNKKSDRVFASIIFYDAENDHSGIAGSTEVGNRETSYHNSAIKNDTPALGIDYTVPVNRLLLEDQGSKYEVDPRVSNRFHQLYSMSDDTFTPNVSHLFAFNQLLAKYINLCYDKVAKKVYIPLIQGFYAGNCNLSIEQYVGKSFPDVAFGKTEVMASGLVGGIMQSSMEFDLMFGYDDAALDANAKSTGKWDFAGVVAATQKELYGVALVSLLLYKYYGINGAATEITAAIADVAKRSDAEKKLIDLSRGIDVANVVRLFFQDGDSFGGDLAKAQTLLKDIIKSHKKKPQDLVTSNISTIGKDLPIPIAGDPSTHNTTSTFGKRADPYPEHILFTTLALMIRNIMYSRNNTNHVYTYKLESLSEVSILKKEELRCHLPAFHQLFKEMITKCEQTKDLLNCGYFDLTRTNLSAIGVNITSNSPIGQGLYHDDKGETIGHKEYKTRLYELCNAIALASNDIVKCIEHVRAELADVPQHLELYQGSLETYKKMNASMHPLAPVSSLIAVHSAVDKLFRRDHAWTMPIASIGDNTFKFWYGHRQTLSDCTPVTGLSGWDDIVAMYSGVTGACDKTHCSKFLEQYVSLSRYIHGVRNYREKLSGSHLFSTVSDVSTAASELHKYNGYIDDNNNNCMKLRSQCMQSNNVDDDAANLGIVISYGNEHNSIYWFKERGHDVAKLITMCVEDTNKDHEITTISKWVNDKAGDKLDSLPIVNILDLNISPINVHALMRDFPLANIYNYAYTADRMFIDAYYGISNDFGNLLIASMCDGEPKNFSNPDTAVTNPGDLSDFGKDRLIKSPKDLLVAMLVDPYRPISNNIETTFMDNIFRGNVNAPLGRPVFISDQLFNKALFGELADESYYKVPGKAATLTKEMAYMRDDLYDRSHNPEYLANDSGIVKSAAIKEDYKKTLKTLGVLRRDTVLSRNLIFMTNLQRTIRMKLHSDMMYNKEVLRSGVAIADPSHTEYSSMEYQQRPGIDDYQAYQGHLKH